MAYQRGTIGFRLTGDGKKCGLDILAPMGAAKQAQNMNTEQRAKFAGKSVFRHEADGGTMVSTLMMRAIGRLDPRNKRGALGHANGYITALMRTSRLMKLPQPTGMKLQAYHAGNPGEFGFSAVIDTPEVSSEAAQDVVYQRMATALGNLQLTHPLCVEVDLEDDGISLSLGGHSSVHTMGWEWEPGAKRIGLLGNNIASGAEPIVYLIGVQALADAATLAQG